MGVPKNQFQITGSPDPNEEAFFTDINQEVLKNLKANEWPRTAESGGPPTVYQDWVQHLPERVAQGWGNYLYTWKRPLGDGVIRFFWVKNKTEAEKNRPIETIISFGNHHWDPILLGVRIQRSRFPRTANVGNVVYRGDTYTATPIFIPSADTGTRFVLRKYSSPAPFEIPQWETPITAAVSFPVPGGKDFNFPECLHPDIPIPKMFDGVSQYTPATATVLNQIGIFKKWFFPATNFKTWESFILYDRQSQDGETGAWVREQMEIFPPPLPRRQIGFR